MSIFLSRFSPTTGELEWLIQDEHYDFHQEFARSAYADMLHDKERNEKYYSALKESISLLHSRGKKAHVLDIGTGTGLLSMMAASCGADSVTACEAFAPVANIAQQIIVQNGFASHITLIPKRSCELTVGPTGDLKKKANILVTEVFDTELIGEGALNTFKHALDCLLETDCIVIPSYATIYVQIVESELVSRWYKPEPIEISDNSKIFPPDYIAECAGTGIAHDLQMTQLSTQQFQAITDPVAIFKFDFSKKNALKFDERNLKQVLTINSGKAHAAFMWWDLQMTPSGKIKLSCAPHWAHPRPSNMQWRDHWMQAIYNLSVSLEVKEGQLINVIGHHDQYQFWFAVTNQSRCNQDLEFISKSFCNCDLHRICSFNRLAQMNNKKRNNTYISALKKLVQPDTVCLCYSDCSLLPLIIAKLGAKQVYTVENNDFAQRVIKSYIETNCLQEKVILLDKITSPKIKAKEINLFFSEPYFISSTLPWNNLIFWYTKEKFASLLSQNCKICPSFLILKGIAVELEHLWKIRAPVGVVEGFDIELFDKHVDKSSRISDSPVESHPLWEYPSVALSLPFEILQFNFKNPVTSISSCEGTVKFQCKGKCNAIALWMEWWLTEENCISTGIVDPAVPGEVLSWDMDYKQGVVFIKDMNLINEESILKYEVNFKSKTGDLDFNFFIL